MNEMTCPRCRSSVVLREWGTYGGDRCVDPDGNILPDSYIEHYSENQGFEIACTNTDCRFTDQQIEVTETRVRRLPPVSDDIDWEYQETTGKYVGDQ